MKEQIDQIFDTFNWIKVHDYMTSVGWTYGDTESPSAFRLMKTAEDILVKAYKESAATQDTACISTGGFVAIAWWDDEPYLSLYFAISQANYEG